MIVLEATWFVTGMAFATATVTSVDGSGTVRWTKTLQAADAGSTITITGSVDPASADIVIAGRHGGSSLDLGDASLTSGGGFVARLAPDGATRWAAVGPLGSNLRATFDAGRVIIGGTDALGAILGEAGPSGVRIAHRYSTGEGISLFEIAGRDAGGVTFRLGLEAGIDLPVDLTIGDTTLTSDYDGRDYLLNMQVE